MKQFVRVLINISVANTSTYLLWSAFSFWIYLETRSVLVLSVLSGTYMLLVTLSSMFFGTIVDNTEKKSHGGCFDSDPASFVNGEHDLSFV